MTTSSKRGWRRKKRPSEERLPGKPPRVDKQSGIWSLEQAKVHYFDAPLAQAIVDLYADEPPDSTVDLGCGKGDYCAAFAAAGWPSVVGYEGTPGIASIGSYPHIFEMDLSIHQELPAKFGLVLCLEVAEHIPANRESIFLNNLVNFSDTTIILSWAVPNQAGVGHVNCKTNAYVTARMLERGYCIRDNASSILRTKSSRPWFKHTLMVFTKE